MASRYSPRVQVLVPIKICQRTLERHVRTKWAPKGVVVPFPLSKEQFHQFHHQASPIHALVLRLKPILEPIGKWILSSQIPADNSSDIMPSPSNTSTIHVSLPSHSILIKCYSDPLPTPPNILRSLLAYHQQSLVIPTIHSGA